jgi:hypothetical protein
VEYEISELGLILAPLFAQLARWVDAHLGEVDRARELRRGRPPPEQLAGQVRTRSAAGESGHGS